MSIEKRCVIYNPTAGRKRSASRWQMIRRLLNNQVEFWPTSHAGHAMELARAACDASYALVGVAGGDGTFHEVANGILRSNRPKTTMGLIPLGSGNDYAMALKLPKQPEQLIELFLSQHVWSVDVGKVESSSQVDTYFINTLGLGLSGAVSWEARQILGLRGLPLYGLAAIKAIWRHFQPLDTTITMDGVASSVPTLFMAVALGSTEGGGFVIAPDARLDDGWFDYLHAANMSRGAALQYLPRLAMGWLPDHGGRIQRGRCRSLRIHSKQPLLIHTDGELYATPATSMHNVSIELCAQALNLRCNPSRHHH